MPFDLLINSNHQQPKIAFNIELGIFAIILACIAWLTQKFRALPSQSFRHNDVDDGDSSPNSIHKQQQQPKTIIGTIENHGKTFTDDVGDDDNVELNNYSINSNFNNRRCSNLTEIRHRNINHRLIQSVDVATQTIEESIQQQQDYNASLQNKPKNFFIENQNNDYDSTTSSITNLDFEFYPNVEIDYLQHHQRKQSNRLSADFETDSDWSSVHSIPLTIFNTKMAAALPQSPTIVPLPPPPPPPMPGTSGSSPMPNWRDLYPSQLPSSIRHEHPPSKQEIEKQQYAHLPDKLLNAMNKDKKPFTYTPSGVSR